MGVVYKGFDTQLQREVAIKVLQSASPTPRTTAHLLEEAKILASLGHSAIVPVHDVGKLVDERPFLVMSFIHGKTLAKELAKRKAPRHDDPRFLQFFETICRAIAKAHAQKPAIVHRDLKPSNIMVTPDNEAFVLDWGIARKLDERKSAVSSQSSSGVQTEAGPAKRMPSDLAPTNPGDAKGTPGFMAPEQARGESSSIGPAADVFALGGLLCMILTNRPPYPPDAKPDEIEGKLRETYQHLKGGTADKELVELAQKCLQPEWKDRPLNASAVLTGLTTARQKIQARLRKAAEEHKHRWIRRSRAAAVVVAIMLAGGGAWYLQNEYTRQLHVTEEAVIPALAKAEQLHNQASLRPMGSSKEIDAALVIWQQASDALRLAEAALQTGIADNRLGQQVKDLGSRIAEARARGDLQRIQVLRRETLFLDLDDARMSMANFNELPVHFVDANRLHFDYTGAAAKYAAAFAKFGLNIQPHQREMLAKKIREQEPAVRDALIVGLDHWIYCAWMTPLRGDLLAIVTAADQDTWRHAYRQATVEGDALRLVQLNRESRLTKQSAVNLDLLALALYQVDQGKETLDLLRWAREVYPTDFWIAMNLGDYLALSKTVAPEELEERIGCYRVAVALRPDSSAAHFNLGVALATQKRLDLAAVEFKTTIALNPNIASAHINLGKILHDTGQLDAAIIEFKKAVDLNPKMALARAELGIALHHNMQFGDAISELEKAIGLNPKDGLAHAVLGEALLKNGKFKEAMTITQVALDLLAETDSNRRLVLHKSINAALS